MFKNILEKIEFIKAKIYLNILGRSLVFYTSISSGDRIKLKLIRKKVIEISEKYFIGMDGEVRRFKYYDLDGYAQDFSMRTLENIEISQYINMKDNNEEEIYEGDILFVSNEYGVFLQLIGFGENEYENNPVLRGFMIEKGYILENNNYGYDNFKEYTKNLIKLHNIPLIEDNIEDTWVDDGWWIIGNKYQNKDLYNLIINKEKVQ